MEIQRVLLLSSSRKRLVRLFLLPSYSDVTHDLQKDALAALNANNHELKKRRIAVTLADSRVRARNRYVPRVLHKQHCSPFFHFRNVTSEAGLSQKADVRSKSVRVRNLPAASQEGLLQQILEKIAPVKRVEVFADLKEAVVELENVAVSRFTLRQRICIMLT
jgi:hypothetical protein